VAATGAVTLKHAGRSMLVEPREDTLHEAETVSPPPPPPPPAPPAPHADVDADEEQMPVSPMSMQDGIRALQQAFTQSPTPPRWPMYVRQAKQFLRNAIDGFDERRYGFASVVDLLRAAGKEGVLRVERDRQGAVRVFPGANLAPRVAPPVEEPSIDYDDQPDEDVPAEPVEVAETMVAEPVADTPIVDADVEVEPEPVTVATEDVVVAEPVKPERKRRAAPPKGRSAKAAKSPKPRSRKTPRSKSEAADKS
jgi:hypothetical protein